MVESAVRVAQRHRNAGAGPPITGNLQCRRKHRSASTPTEADLKGKHLVLPRRCAAHGPKPWQRQPVLLVSTQAAPRRQRGSAPLPVDTRPNSQRSLSYAILGSLLPRSGWDEPFPSCAARTQNRKLTTLCVNVSTRGSRPRFCRFEEALLTGLARDGVWYVPETIPHSASR